MNPDDKVLGKLLLGALSWTTLFFMSMLVSEAFCLFFLFVTAVIGLFSVLPKPKAKPYGRKAFSVSSFTSDKTDKDVIEQLLAHAKKEALFLQDVRTEYGDEVAQQVEERVRQLQALNELEVE